MYIIRPLLSLQTKDIEEDSSPYKESLKKPHPPPEDIDGAKKGHYTTFFKASHRFDCFFYSIFCAIIDVTYIISHFTKAHISIESSILILFCKNI